MLKPDDIKQTLNKIVLYMTYAYILDYLNYKINLYIIDDIDLRSNRQIRKIPGWGFAFNRMEKSRT